MFEFCVIVHLFGVVGALVSGCSYFCRCGKKLKQRFIPFILVAVCPVLNYRMMWNFFKSYDYYMKTGYVS